MTDVVYRQAVLDEILSLHRNEEVLLSDMIYNMVVHQAYEKIDALPSAEPETAKRIVGKSRDGMTLWYQCDMCNEPVDVQDNYCRGCGRRLIDE